MPVPPWRDCSTTVGKLQYHHGGTGDTTASVRVDALQSSLPLPSKGRGQGWGEMSVCLLFPLDNKLGEELFAFLLGDAPPLAVVAELVAVDAANGEELRFGVADEEAADGCGGLDAVMVGEGDIQLSFSLQSVEDDALERMVGTRGVAEGNTK